MKVAVIGAGVVGVTTAHYLTRQGVKVEVFEFASNAATETSHSNAGQLSYSFTDSLADPSMFSKILPTLLGLDLALRIRPSLKPSFLSWGVRFLRECSHSRSEANSSVLLTLALRSATLMKSLAAELPEFGHHRRGKLVLLSAVTKSLQDRIKLKQSLGHNIRLVSTDEAKQIEPALNDWNYDLNAAIYSPDDEVGDAREFTLSLARNLEHSGVQFHYETSVEGIVTDPTGGCKGLIVDGTAAEFDAVVVCAGNASRNLVSSAGLSLQTLPVAGYSLTLPPGENSGTTSITASDQKFVISRSETYVRISGFADINQPARVANERVKELNRIVHEVAPNVADFQCSGKEEWIGYRCMTPSGIPYFGATAVNNLYLNTGHGMFGWTLAAATAEEVARSVTQASSQMCSTSDLLHAQTD